MEAAAVRPETPADAERFYRAAGWTPDGRKNELFLGTAVVELRYRKPL